MRAADALAKRIDAAADRTFSIRALSRTNPHVFAEDKDAVRAELRAIAAEVRNTFSGQAGQFRPGPITVVQRGRERRVLVATRRRAA